jgi:hypothetical protein
MKKPFPIKPQARPDARPLSGQNHPTRARIVQPKKMAAPQKPEQKVAPPVYRPQAVPKVLQRKTVAPPAYRPQAAPKVLQRQTAPGQMEIRDSKLNQKPPVAPPAYRPQPVPKVLQLKKTVQGPQASASESSRLRGTAAPATQHLRTVKTAQPKMALAARTQRKRPEAPPVYRPAVEAPQPKGAPHAPERASAVQRQATHAERARHGPAAARPGKNPGGVIQRRLWDESFNQLSVQQAQQVLGGQVVKDEEDRRVLAELEGEELDYVIPNNQQQHAQIFERWKTAYLKQDKINITKLLNIINSILNHGVLNQQDRESLLNPQNKATTSTDDPKGSSLIHGMLLDNPQNIQSASKTAQSESINVLAEVKDDILTTGTKQRIYANILTKEERTHLLSVIRSNNGLADFVPELTQELETDKNTPGAVKLLHLGGAYMKQEVLSFALNKVFASSRGTNEINKRMMTGFLAIIDAEQINQEDWDITQKLGEGVVKKSISAPKIIKLILPKYLEQYKDRINNPHQVTIVYRTIDYPTDTEIHLYLPTGERIQFKGQIDLKWKEEVEQVLTQKPKVLTHMARGF